MRKNNTIMSFPSDLAIEKNDRVRCQGRPNLHPSDATTSVAPCYTMARPLKLTKD